MGEAISQPPTDTPAVGQLPRKVGVIRRPTGLDSRDPVIALLKRFFREQCTELPHYVLSEIRDLLLHLKEREVITKESELELTLLGAGGQGAVYSLNILYPKGIPGIFRGAAHKSQYPMPTDTSIAIKISHNAKQLAKEIEITKAAPAAPRVIGNGKFLMATETINGITGSTVVNPTTRDEFTERERLYFALQVAKALTQIHKQGIIHCDLKPSNLLLNRLGDLYLVDYGIARRWRTTLRTQQQTSLLAPEMSSETYGTIEYISPEQVLGSQDLTPQTDIFAFGNLLFKLFSDTQITFNQFLGAKGVIDTIRILGGLHVNDVNRVIGGQISDRYLQSILRTALSPQSKDRCESGEMIMKFFRDRLDQMSPSPSWNDRYDFGLTVGRLRLKLEKQEGPPTLSVPEALSYESVCDWE